MNLKAGVFPVGKRARCINLVWIYICQSRGSEDAYKTPQCGCGSTTPQLYESQIVAVKSISLGRGPAIKAHHSVMWFFLKRLPITATDPSQVGIFEKTAHHVTRQTDGRQVGTGGRSKERQRPPRVSVVLPRPPLLSCIVIFTVFVCEKKIH